MDADSLSLAYCYGCRNAGDFAINQGSLRLLDRTANGADVTAVSRFARESDEFQEMSRKLDTVDEESSLFGGPIAYDSKSQSTPEQLLSLAKSGINYGFDLTGIASDSSLHSNLYRQIIGSDVFLYNGGNAIHYSPSHQSVPYLLAVLYPLQVARRNDIPYGILPQTMFDIQGVAKRLVVPILNDAAFVMTRDQETFRYLSEFGLTTQLINAIDTAFLSGDTSMNPKLSSKRKEIAVVPRFSTLGDTGRLDSQGQRMERTFFEYLERLVADGHDVTLTIQTEMDKRWAEQNAQQLDSIGISQYANFDPDELRSFYADVDLLVTMRLHAGIFALSVGTPAIGVYRPEWGPKIQGTWETLDIKRYAMTWDAATLEHLTEVTERALGEVEQLSRDIASRVKMRNQQMVSDFRSALETAAHELND